MYVCLCNGISDKKIRQAVRQFSPLVPAIKKIHSGRQSVR